jgi:hypothetical protein
MSSSSRGGSVGVHPEEIDNLAGKTGSRMPPWRMPSILSPDHGHHALNAPVFHINGPMGSMFPSFPVRPACI